jgi:hypothetical protein
MLIISPLSCFAMAAKQGVKSVPLQHFHNDGQEKYSPTALTFGVHIIRQTAPKRKGGKPHAIFGSYSLNDIPGSVRKQPSLSVYDASPARRCAAIH